MWWLPAKRSGHSLAEVLIGSALMLLITGATLAILHLISRQLQPVDQATQITQRSIVLFRQLDKEIRRCEFYALDSNRLLFYRGNYLQTNVGPVHTIGMNEMLEYDRSALWEFALDGQGRIYQGIYGQSAARHYLWNLGVGAQLQFLNYSPFAQVSVAGYSLDQAGLPQPFRRNFMLYIRAL